MMRVIARALFLLPFLSLSSWATWSLVNNCAGVSPNANSVGTCTINTAGANFIVIYTTGFRSGTCVLSDGFSNSYTNVRCDDTGSQQTGCIDYDVSPTTGVTHSFSFGGTNCFAGIAVQAWSGAGSSPLDQQNGFATSSFSGSTIQPGSITPSQQNELIISGLSETVTHSPVIDSTMTVTASQGYNGGQNYGIAMAYGVQTTIFAINPIWTTGSQMQITTSVASFKIPQSILVPNFGGLLINGAKTTIMGLVTTQ